MRQHPSPRRILALILVLSLAVGGCAEPTPTATPTPEATPTPTPAPTATPVPTPTPLPLAEWVAEGDAALARSDFVAAEAAYQRAAAADPGYAPAHAGLAWTYAWQMNREKDALAAAQAATDLAPEDASAWAVLAHALRLRNQTTKAVEAAEKAVALDPTSALAQAGLARAYASDLRHDAALVAAVQAVELDPQSAYAYTALAVVHEAMADFGRAQAAVEQAIALQPQCAQWHAHLGGMLARQLRYGAAQDAYGKALALAPEYTKALLGQAGISLSQRKYEEAEQLIARAAEGAPDSAQPLLDWGYLYLAQEEYEKAAAKFAAAVGLDADDWHGLAGQAAARRAEGDCESAASMLQDLSASHPRAADLRVDNAWAKICLGDGERALELVRVAIELDPYYAAAHELHAALLAAQERWDDATKAYLLSRRYSAAPASVHQGLGDIYMDRDELDYAEAEYALAGRLDPDGAGGPSGLCSVAWWRNDPAEMLGPCEQAAKLDPQDIDAQTMWGAALYLNKRFPEAAEVLKAALGEDPEHGLGHLYLGMVYLRLQQYPLAKKELETYIKIEEISDQRFDYLIAAADQGWNLSEAVALAQLEEAGDAIAQGAVTWKLESTGAITRTLTASLQAKPDDKPEATYQTAAAMLGLAAVLAIRLSPQVNGGAIVTMSDAAQKPIFVLRVSADDMWLFVGGDLSNEQFAERIDFVQEADGARSPEMTDKLVQTTGAAAEKLRELAAKQAVPSERLDQAGLEAHLETSKDPADLDEAYSDDLLLTMLGALDSEVDLLKTEEDMQAEQVLGFYDEEDKTFYVVTDKAPGLTDTTTVAHEYVHALQDQHFDIGAVRQKIEDDDRRIAYTALVEGDASLVTLQFMATLPQLELMQTLEAAQAEADRPILEASPAVLRGWMAFPYDQGLAFVLEVYETGGWEAVNKLYEAPPTSTEQLLHPEKYRAGEQPIEVPLPELSSILGGDWRIRNEDSLGELTWRLILEELAGPATAEAAAAGWSGDHYILLQEGDDGPGATLLRAAWDTTDDAEEFWAALRTALTSRTGFGEVVDDLVGDGLARRFRSSDAYWIVQLDDKDVTLTIGPEEGVAEKLFAAAR